jgi:hypothetical protein
MMPESELADQPSEPMGIAQFIGSVGVLLLSVPAMVGA